jgi:hypothetical protein
MRSHSWIVSNIRELFMRFDTRADGRMAGLVVVKPLGYS